MIITKYKKSIKTDCHVLAVLCVILLLTVEQLCEQIWKSLSHFYVFAPEFLRLRNIVYKQTHTHTNKQTEEHIQKEVIPQIIVRIIRK